jgi:hypothetical protein
MKYKKITDDANFSYIEKTDEDGKVWSIPMDESNSDYQAYLAHLTESVTKAK